MVDFRRGITALGMFALFTGLAAAQVGGTGQQQLTCNTNVTVTPALRGEGYTEQTGDITITCTGGAPIAIGGQVPLVNIAVFYNTTVTSRLLPTTSGSTGGQTSNQTSEALLLVDEPGSGLPGFGPSLGQTLCILAGVGRVQSWGQKGRLVRAGHHRSRHRDRRGGPAVRLRPLLPRPIGAVDAGLGSGSGHRGADRGAPRRQRERHRQPSARHDRHGPAADLTRSSHGILTAHRREFHVRATSWRAPTTMRGGA